MNWDQTNAKCLVFTYKDGLLSRVGHDLKLRCDRFSVSLDDHRVDATFDPSAFTVVAALKGGREHAGALSDKDRRQILQNMRREVLRPERFPEIRYRADRVESGLRTLTAHGELTLHGVSRPVVATARRVDGELVAELELNTPDFGIAPFSALLGTLKVKPRIKVRLVLPGS